MSEYLLDHFRAFNTGNDPVCPPGKLQSTILSLVRFQRATDFVKRFDSTAVDGSLNEPVPSLDKFSSWQKVN
jgi:hypothetical protein